MTEPLPARTLIGEVSLDVTMSFRLGQTSTLTRYPVEVGAQRSDHATENPLRLQIDGAFTDAPLLSKDREDRGMQQQVNLRSPSTASTPGTAKKNFGQLTQYREDRQAVTVAMYTGDSFDNMVITGLDSNYDAKTGAMIRFSVTLEQIIFAETKRVSLDFTKMKNQKKPTQKENQGKQTAPDASSSKSLAASIYDVFRGN